MVVGVGTTALGDVHSNTALLTAGGQGRLDLALVVEAVSRGQFSNPELPGHAIR